MGRFQFAARLDVASRVRHFFRFQLIRLRQRLRHCCCLYINDHPLRNIRIASDHQRVVSQCVVENICTNCVVRATKITLVSDATLRMQSKINMRVRRSQAIR